MSAIPDSETSKQSRCAIVLAAGMGTRFRSRLPKVLHRLCGKPMIAHVLDTLKDLGIDRTLVVIGHEAEEVRRALEDYAVEFVLQAEQLGTGHAVQCASSELEKSLGNTLVLYGDTPMLRTQTLENLFAPVEEGVADQVVLTAEVDDPHGLGRIIRDARGRAVDTVEEKDATAQQKKIRETNSGVYCFKIPALLWALPQLKNENNSGEFYLTDVMRILVDDGKRVETVSTDFPREVTGINDRSQLATAGQLMRAQIVEDWMLKGVTILDPRNVYIDSQVELSPDTLLYPGVILEGNTRVGRDSVIHAHSHLNNAVIGAGVVIDQCSVVRDSRIGDGSTVGPFAHLRQNSVVGSGVRIGNFVEIKKARLDDGTKAAHLSYLGDAVLGKDVNVGAGTITCNYDGVRKNTTTIEDGVFIGSNTQLIAPVRIGRNAYVAAGSTITESVPPGSLAIARSRQVNKTDWKSKKKKSS